MTLSIATLLPAVVLLLAGLLFLVNSSTTVSMVRGFPRSLPAAVLFFGGGALWFQWVLSRLSAADLIFFQNPTPVMIFFGIVSLAAFFYVPDFLAVRGLCVCVLLGAIPILNTFFGEYDKSQRLFVVAPLMIVALPIALWFGASPFRGRDFLDWLYRAPGRARAFGAGLVAYGAVLAVVAFTY